VATLISFIILCPVLLLFFDICHMQLCTYVVRFLSSNTCLQRFMRPKHPRVPVRGPLALPPMQWGGNSDIYYHPVPCAITIFDICHMQLCTYVVRFLSSNTCIQRFMRLKHPRVPVRGPLARGDKDDLIYQRMFICLFICFIDVLTEIPRLRSVR